MTDPATPTFDSSLALLIDAVGKAADDLRAVHGILQRTRAESLPAGGAVERNVMAAATRAIDHLRGTDEALSAVVKALEHRG